MSKFFSEVKKVTKKSPTLDTIKEEGARKGKLPQKKQGGIFEKIADNWKLISITAPLLLEQKEAIIEVSGKILEKKLEKCASILSRCTCSCNSIF